MDWRSLLAECYRAKGEKLLHLEDELHKRVVGQNETQSQQFPMLFVEAVLDCRMQNAQ